MPDVVKFVEGYLAGVEYGSKLAREAQNHEDTTLTWALALMGGGLLALPSTLQTLNLRVDSARHMYLLACLPWLVGSIVALAGRFAYRKLRVVDNTFWFDKTTLLRRILVDDHPETAGQRVRDIQTNKTGDLAKYGAMSLRWSRRAAVLFFATHTFLALGFLSISAFVVWRSLFP